MRPTKEQIAEAMRRHLDGLPWLELARELGCVRVEEHITNECQAAFRDALDRGIVALGDRLEPVPGRQIESYR